MFESLHTLDKLDRLKKQVADLQHEVYTLKTQQRDLQNEFNKLYRVTVKHCPKCDGEGRVPV